MIPPFESYAVEGRTYRYATKAPLHPFGYGLSYTTFAYSDVAWNGKTVRARVTNTGGRDGEEVAQLYLRAPEGCGDRRRHRLAGFRRLSLERGAFAVCNDDGVFRVPAGRHVAFVGGGQPGLAQAVSVAVDMREEN